MNEKRVFILGAVLSKQVGMPLAKEHMFFFYEILRNTTIRKCSSRAELGIDHN